ncbi:MAG: GNAT family N-acetyltransferase [Ruminococcaceae bacterium]|nr:GNAT family N-acetyltransferase [Oscillospiraceae bacterium]
MPTITILPAEIRDLDALLVYDRHIPAHRLADCIHQKQVYVLKEESGNASPIRGILRYSLFWQTLPFLDLLFLDEACRGKGCGKAMMRRWEADMKAMGFSYTLTSTQSDETAYRFYEAIGYHRIGGFFPPGQEAEEWIYGKAL